MGVVIAFVVGVVTGPIVLIGLARMRWSNTVDRIRNWDSPERRQMTDYDRTGDSVI